MAALANLAVDDENEIEIGEKGGIRVVLENIKVQCATLPLALPLAQPLPSLCQRNRPARASPYKGECTLMNEEPCMPHARS